LIDSASVLEEGDRDDVGVAIIPALQNPALKDRVGGTRTWHRPEERDRKFADSPLEGDGFELVLGLVLSRNLFLVFCCFFVSSGKEPFFVPSPAIRFPERAEAVKGPKRLAQLGGLPLSSACVSQRLDG